MKKAHLWVLIAVTLVFAAFTTGFFLGRNREPESVVVSVPAVMQTEPPQTTIPSVPPETFSHIPTSPSFPLNINSATKEDLTTLPGIGDVLAQRILNYRNRNGGFASVDELLNVEGIGEKRMESIKDLITIGG